MPTRLMLITIGFAVLAASAPAGAAPEKGWIMRQKQILTGDQTLFIAANAVRINNDAMGYTIIVKVGDTDKAKSIFVINDASKRYCTVDLAHTQQFFAGRLAEIHQVDTKSTADLVWKKAGKDQIKAFETEHWIGKKWLKPDADRPKDKPKLRTFEAWYPTGMKVNPKLAEILAKIHGWPNVPNIASLPVKGTLKDGNDRPKIGVELVFLKEAPLPDSLFVPKVEKYKKVASTDEVVMSGSRELVIEEMADTLGAMYQDDTKKQKGAK